jgi:hypothetical protein
MNTNLNAGIVLGLYYRFLELTAIIVVLHFVRWNLCQIRYLAWRLTPAFGSILAAFGDENR